MSALRIATPKGIRIKKCEHGYGIFGEKKFNIGQRIAFIVGGKTVANPSKASMFALKVPRRRLWWDETDLSRPDWDSFLDHSDTANARIVFTRFNPSKPRAGLIAINPIAKNEEITINYREYGDRLYRGRQRGAAIQ